MMHRPMPIPTTLAKALEPNYEETQKREREKEKGGQTLTKDVGSFDLKNVDDVRRLTLTLQKNDSITFLNDIQHATPEQSITALLHYHKEQIAAVRDGGTPLGLIGVSSQQTFTRRMHDGNEFLMHLEPGIYQHRVMTLDETSFDYATDISVTVHFIETATPEELDKCEVYLTCCRFAVFSTKLRITKALSGAIVGEADLIKIPNLFPVRHTTWATPSNIMVRECGRIIKQVDIHLHGILTFKLMDEQWFMTPARMPVKVTNGIAIFDRAAFLETVPVEFRHRYMLP